MEEILELVLSVAVEIVNGIKFKNPKTRTRALSIVFFLLFASLLGLSVWGGITLFQQGTTVGAIVMGIIGMAIILVGLIVIVRGHKTNWEKS